MKPTVYSKATGKGIQSFYVNVDGKEYYLFSQDHRVSVKAVFQNPVQIDKIFNYSGTQKTMR